jgi:hypothetical protein
MTGVLSRHREDYFASPDLGVKLIELVARNPELSSERFHYYWHTIHGFKAAQHVSTQMGGYMNRYVQCHMIEPQVAGLPPFKWDGIVEGWFDSEEAFEKLWNLPGYLENLRPEEPDLIDEQRSTAFLCRGAVLVDRGALPPAGAKLVIALQPRADLDEDTFVKALEAHGQRAARCRGLLHYSQALAVRDPVNPLPNVDAPAAGSWKGFEALAWPDLLRLEEEWENMHDTFLRDLDGFADLSSSAAFITDERVMF